MELCIKVFWLTNLIISACNASIVTELLMRSILRGVCTLQTNKHRCQQEILLDCDQSNVFLTRIIFFCILLRAFSFLSVGIRNSASNWDPFNIILIVTGVEVVIGNCLPEVHKILPDSRNWEKKLSNNGRWRLLPLIVLLYLNACVYLAPLWRYGRLNFFQEGSTWNRGRSSVVGRSSILHWSHILLFATLRT